MRELPNVDTFLKAAGEKAGAQELAKVALPLEAANEGFGSCALA
jgi:hypothetical protein